jgi:hypothetical protein
MTNLELATKWVSSLIDKGFKSGWFGDKSELFRQQEIGIHTAVLEGTYHIHPVHLVSGLVSDIINLRHYCGWTDEEVNELLGRFGFESKHELLDLSHHDNALIKKVIVNNKYDRNLLT